MNDGAAAAAPICCYGRFMKFGKVILTSALLLFSGCSRNSTPRVDRPRLTPNVELHDVTFRSASLEREITYRVILPKSLPSKEKLPLVYLLHGGGGDFRGWSNDSDIAGFAEKGFILVMPE